ncbi:MAG: DNRLRE domain-containing protein, partial [Methylococcales bacterium]|nr:DNRLRE domain-containing protein [Methylococcales bacterium]
GDSVNITVVATATIGGVITKNVSVSGDVIDSNGNNDTASEETTVYQTIATQTFSPIHDSYVKLGNGSNYGSDTRLRLRDGSPDYDSYLKFDLSTLAGPVESATLRLYIDSNGNNSSSVYSVSNDYEGTSTPWEEMALNGNNAPVWSGSPLDTVGPGTNGEWLEWDVTNALTDPATYSFAISTNSSNSVYYNSSENGSNQPDLVVNVNVCTPPVAVADMVASTDGTAVTLNWTGAADQYEVWIGNNDPYFAPGNECAAAPNCEIITPPPAEYVHVAGAGDTAVNHSYIILAVNNCTASSVRSGNSNRTGAFDFAIQPGS